MLTIRNIKLNREWLFVTPIGVLTYLWGVDGRANTFWRRTGGRCRMVTTCPCVLPTPSAVLSQLHPCPLSPAPVGSCAALWSCYCRPVNGILPATTRGQLKSRRHAKTYALRRQAEPPTMDEADVTTTGVWVWISDLWRQYNAARHWRRCCCASCTHQQLHYVIDWLTGVITQYNRMNEWRNERRMNEPKLCKYNFRTFLKSSRKFIGLSLILSRLSLGLRSYRPIHVRRGSLKFAPRRVGQAQFVKLLLARSHSPSLLPSTLSFILPLYL